TFPFLLFALFMGIFGSGQSAPTVSVGVLDLDSTPASVRYVEFLKAGYERSKVFKPAFRHVDEAGPVNATAKGRGILITIRKGFASRRHSGESAQVQLRQLDGDYRS